MNTKANAIASAASSLIDLIRQVEVRAGEILTNVEPFIDPERERDDVVEAFNDLTSEVEGLLDTLEAARDHAGDVAEAADAAAEIRFDALADTLADFGLKAT